MQLCCSCGQTCFCVSRRQMSWCGFSITGPKMFFFFYRGILKSCLVFSPWCLCWWIRGCVTERGRERESVWGRVLQRHRTKFLPNFRTPWKKKSRRALCLPVVSAPAENLLTRTKLNFFFLSHNDLLRDQHILVFACLVMINILSGSLYFVLPVCLVQV